MSDIECLRNALDENTITFCLKGIRTMGKVVGVHDGDTLKVVINYRGCLTKFTCRMSGYDSPELKDKDNPDSWIATNTLVNECTDVSINVNEKLGAKEIANLMKQNTKTLTVEFLGSDKYGRELIKLHDEQGCINDRLMTYSYNIVYNGRGSRPIHEKHI